MTSIALDTNLLALFVIGRGAGRVVGKRLKAFTDDDFSTLAGCIAPHDRLITTINAWTEFYNIWDWGIEGHLRAEILATSMEIVATCIEVVRASSEVIRDPEFGRLGLSDCVWLSILDHQTTLLTDDIALFNVAHSRGFIAVNFNHLRFPG